MKSKLTALLLVVLVTLFYRPPSADAFCGFYVGGAGAELFNNATLVVLMRDGTRTVLSMQNNYQGPPANFAMVVPVPVVLGEENVKTLPRDIFERTDALTAPRLVEYWEQDPCAPPASDYSYTFSSMPAPSAVADMSADSASHGVTIEAKFSVAEYDILILSAKDSSGLETWLHENSYTIPSGAEPLLRPYVQMGMKFFVAKVDVSKVAMKGGMAMLSPLRFFYDSDTFFLPIRLGLVNSKGTQDLIVHILARGQRYEVANYDNVTIPTNLDVTEAAKDRFGSMYAALFDRTLEKQPRAVVTEYAWASSSCDPCPAPTLSPQDIATLGADALTSWNDSDMSQTAGFVVTRLHLRYTKGGLGDDLFFRAAPPIVGGREFVQKDGKLEQGAMPASENNFQARYAIRHPWRGPVECANPKRGIWGGPPGQYRAAGGDPKPALNLAFVARGASLGEFFTGDVPDGKLLSTGGTSPTFKVPPGPSGCTGCAVGVGGSGVAVGAGLGFLALLVVRRRRRG